MTGFGRIILDGLATDSLIKFFFGIIIHSMRIRTAALSEIDALEKCMKTSMRALGQGHYTPTQIDACLEFLYVPNEQLICDKTIYVVEDADDQMLMYNWIYTATADHFDEYLDTIKQLFETWTIY